MNTSRGAEDHDAKDGESILIRNGPKALAGAVAAAVTEDDLPNRLGRTTRKSVEREYIWETVGDNLLRLYTGLATEQV